MNDQIYLFMRTLILSIGLGPVRNEQENKRKLDNEEERIG